jgi:ribosomal protein L3 glutamine methyltransferase
MTLLELVERSARALDKAELVFGHGTQSAMDEAAWLVLWRLGLPIDTDLNSNASVAQQLIDADQVHAVEALIRTRIERRLPAAYLTHEAWLQGVPFYVDERAIVPRSLIAELLVDGSLDYWLHETTQHVLDVCTGNGSLAVLAAMVYPEVTVTASDLSTDALAVAKINIERHQLQSRIELLSADGLDAAALQARGPFDLILCNPPYVNADSMAALPPEYLAEPSMALDGNTAGGRDGMDFVRALLRDAALHMTPQAVLVLEIGHERDHFEAAFPKLSAIWLDTSAGGNQVLLLRRDDLQTLNSPH